MDYLKCCIDKFYSTVSKSPEIYLNRMNRTYSPSTVQMESVQVLGARLVTPAELPKLKRDQTKVGMGKLQFTLKDLDSHANGGFFFFVTIALMI